MSIFSVNQVIQIMFENQNYCFKIDGNKTQTFLHQLLISPLFPTLISRGYVGLSVAMTAFELEHRTASEVGAVEMCSIELTV
jgi:hypothetical protein